MRQLMQRTVSRKPSQGKAATAYPFDVVAQARWVLKATCAAVCCTRKRSWPCACAVLSFALTLGTTTLIGTLGLGVKLGRYSR